MAHDEEQERHSAVKQKPVDSLKFTPLAWNLSFEGQVRNVRMLSFCMHCYRVTILFIPTFRMTLPM